MQKIILLVLLLLSFVQASKEARLGGFDGFVERMGASARELGR